MCIRDSIRRHRPQLGHALLDDRVQIEAAEVVACLFARHREAGGVDQADQVLGVDHEAVAETIGRHDRKVARGQHRQVELGASGDDLEPRCLLYTSRCV